MNTYSTYNSLISTGVRSGFLTESRQDLAFSLESSFISQSLSNSYYNDIAFKHDNAGAKTSEFDKVSTELVSYQDLAFDWDGYGGIAPDYTTVALAFNFLSELYAKNLKLPKLMVSGNGDICFYWKDKYTKSYLEVQFDSSNKYSYFLESDASVSGNDDIDFHESSITEDIFHFLNLAFGTDYLMAA